MSTQLRPTHAPVQQTGAIPTLHTLQSLRDFRQQPLHFLAGLPAQYGDLVHIKIFFWPVLIINHPEYIKHVLQDHHQNYNKDVPIFRLFRPVLGNGLVTNYGGESWLQQRRLIQPAFHRQHIGEFGASITASTEEMLCGWDAKARARHTFDVAEEMMHLTLRIVSEALFHSDISEGIRPFEEAFEQVNGFLLDYFHRPFPPLTVPTPRHQRFWKALRTLDTVVYELIRQRRCSGVLSSDLLSLLIQARDEETNQGMSDQQLRDEVMTTLIAGHETSANALAWCWYLLAQNPEAERKLHQEVDTVLAGRLPGVDDLAKLPYTRMVFEEAMRLYPPVWLLMRKALRDDTIGGYHVAANTYVLWSTYALHRHPDFWDNPEQFEPERFLPERLAQRPRHAYLPFSHGPRLCVGNAFAMTEAQLIIATIAQRYCLHLVPQQEVEPQPLMTLRPRNGIRMYLEARK